MWVKYEHILDGKLWRSGEFEQGNMKKKVI